MRAMRWTPVVLGTAVLVSLLAAAVIVFVTRPDQTAVDPSATPSVRPSGPTISSPSPSPSPTAQALAFGSYVGPAYDRNLVEEPTQPAAQSRLWFNDGSWWGLLVSRQSNRVEIHELHWESQQWVGTGVLVDDRTFADQDAVWDGTSLYVAGSGTRNSMSDALMIWHFGYDAEVRRYVLEPDSPLIVTPTGVETPTLAVTSDGQAWVAYVSTRAVYVSHSLAEQTGWSAPMRLPTERAAPAEAAAIVATDDGVAVAWTEFEQDTLHIAQHPASSPDDTWPTSSVAIDGLRYGQDELSVHATSDGSLLTLVRSSLDRVENRNPDAPQLVLAHLRADTWRQAVVGRVRDGHEGPRLLVDEARGDVYVVAESDGSVYLKHATLDDLAFDAGLGQPIIEPLADPSPSVSPSPGASPGEAPAVPEVVGASSTKQDLGVLSEIVVMAANDVAGRYAHAVIALPGGRAVPSAAGHLGLPPDDVVDGLPPGVTTFVLRDSFGPFAPGPATSTGWQSQNEPVDELLVVATPTEGDPSLRLTPDAAGEGPRVCKAFPSATSGVVIATANVQPRGTPQSDATLMALRSDGDEIASVRFGLPGTFRYFVGDERITSNVAYERGVWYESTLIIDLTAQTYDWQVAPVGLDAAILTISGQPLRGPAPSVDEICVQSADELPGGDVELYVDDVTIAVGPGG